MVRGTANDLAAHSFTLALSPSTLGAHTRGDEWVRGEIIVKWPKIKFHHREECGVKGEKWSYSIEK